MNFYTDGASSGNPGKGGFGVVCLMVNQISYSYSEYFDNVTNNQMELKAILHVLKTFPHLRDMGYDITIYSDSAYCVNMLNDWIWKWAANGWKRLGDKPIENLDIITEIYEYLKQPKEKGMGDLYIVKVSGHSGIIGNELADALATNNIIKYKSLIKKNSLEEDIKTREA